MEDVGNRILSSKITEDISSEPVSASDFKVYANITYSDYDPLIEICIKSSRLLLQNCTGKVFGEATVQCEFTHSGKRPIKLPWAWYAAIISIEYRACRLNDWDEVTLGNVDYEIDNDAFFGYQGHWRLVYKTEDVELPEDILTAIKAQAKFIFENRNNPDMNGKLDPIAKMLISPHIAGGMLL